MSRTFYSDRSSGPGQEPGPGIHMQQMLAKMRFALRRKNRMANYRVGCAALLAFQGIHGHNIVDSAFTVPADGDSDGDSSAYPAAARGFPLGAFYHYLINELKDGDNETALRHIARLRRRGVVVGSKTEAKIRRFLSALRIFKQRHGHLNVPASYVVPTSDEARIGVGEGGEGGGEGGGGSSVEFPRWLQGAPLGRWTRLLPETQPFAAYSPLLREFGLEELQDPARCARFSLTTVRRVLSALATFQQIHGHVKVPPDYCVRRNPSMRRKEVGGGRWLRRREIHA